MTDADYTIPRLEKRIEAMGKQIPTSVAQIEYRSGIPVPAIPVGTPTVDIPTTWDTPFPDANYFITKPQIDIAAITLLGKADAKVKSQTKTGCIITVTSATVIAVGQLTISVLAYRKV